MRQSYLIRHILIAALTSALSATPGWSWGTETGGNPKAGILEEILVTARRRDESSMAVPMSLTRLDGVTLDNLQYRDIDDILSLSPGVLVYTGGDGVGSQITIRGVVTPGELVEPGNAVYVDEIYASGMRSVLPGFYDIESVQVLKGPQAGLYGRNTTGGAVVITTGQPTDELFARLNASYAQYDTAGLDGTVNLPLSDSVRIRSTLWYNDRDGGYYESAFVNQNLDASHERGGRITLAVLPDERTAITLTGEYAKIKEAGFSAFGGVVEGARFGPPPLAPESRRNVLRDDLGGLEQDVAGINGKVDFDAAAGSFIAVAGWREIKGRDPGSDWDGTAYVTSYADFLANRSNPLYVPSPQVLTRDDRNQSLNAELRFLTSDSGGPLRTQVGVSYFEEKPRLFTRITPVRSFAQLLTSIGENGSGTRHSDLQTRSWAGFTELIWATSETIEVTADLRYTRDRKKIDTVLAASGFYSPSGSSSISLGESDTFDNWSPGITLAYKPDDTRTVYGKYVRGFRAGGFNGLVYNPALLSYESEEAENYELGFKALLLAGRLEFGASVFYLRIDNALLPVSDPNPNPEDYFIASPPLQNAAVVETTGLEIDLAAQLADGLSLSASAGAYHFTQANATPGGFDTRPFVPDYTASLLADYDHPLTEAITGIASLGYRHRNGGRVPTGDEVKMDSYHLIDAQLGVRMGRVQVAGFVQNALDDNYVTGNYALGGGQVLYAIGSGLNPLSTRVLVHDPGRVFGVRLTVLL